MKVAIIGTGGIGGYFGGKIAHAGYDVTFLARGNQLNALLKQGLTVKSILGDFHVDSIQATDRIENIEKSDLIILCTKAWQLKEFAGELKSILNDNSVILPLQNGVLAVEDLEKEIDRKYIVGGLCRIISKIESPGVINHLGIKPSIVIGELDNTRTNRIEMIKDLFDRSGIDSKISNDITADLWKKFISICVSGLLAVTKTTYGELRELPQTRQMMVDLLIEIYQLSQKMGIQIDADFVAKSVSAIDGLPYDTTSSLIRDVWEGKPSEIEYQNGTVVRLAEKYGVDVPINRFVYNCILPMELKARKTKIQAAL
jgi:2-dehydropantoate 2-reductase